MWITIIIVQLYITIITYLDFASCSFSWKKSLRQYSKFEHKKEYYSGFVYRYDSLVYFD